MYESKNKIFYLMTTIYVIIEYFTHLNKYKKNIKEMTFYELIILNQFLIGWFLIKNEFRWLPYKYETFLLLQKLKFYY